MNRTLAAFFAVFGPLCAVVLAQDIPGVRATLVAEQQFVPATGDAKLKLVLDAQQDATLPADLLSGIQLDVKVSDQPGPQIREAGKGGPANVTAGTRIERRISLPIGKLCPNGPGDAGKVALQWPGLTGANCVLTVAPDVSKIAIDDLDLEKTRVVLVTNFGTITLGFYPAKAPATVKNFVQLAKSGFYDGTKFHRVIRNYMVQGGDPNTKDDTKQATWGQGGPGYSIKGEVNDTRHARGVISMANSGSPDTAGSQFFICHREAQHLNKGYTAFGAIEDGGGLDVLDAIANVPCSGEEGSRPLSPVVLQQAVVLPVLKKK